MLCFTGAHARLPELLATLNRGGLRLVVRRCTTLLDFARELTRNDATLVGIDCGAGNLRLADVVSVFRKAGRKAPVVLISDDTPQTRAVAATLSQCVTVAPGDLAGLASAIRDASTGAGGDTLDAPDQAAPSPVSPNDAAPPEPPDLADEQGLLDALRQALVAASKGALLAVVRASPEPPAPALGTWARLLGDALGAPKVLARLDGGRYGALLTLADPAAGVALAHDLRQTLLGHPLVSAPQQGPGTVAIGISPPRATDGYRAEAWLARTLEACDLAARTEHGYAVLSRVPVTAPSARDIPALLQEALVANQLILQFQPIVSLRGDARQHYEALVRLPSLTAGDLLPSEFFGPALASGLMSAVDHWVIRTAIRRLSRERATNRRIHLFIPLSAQSLADERLLVAICDELRGVQAAGDWLTFQLRPRDLRAHPVRTRQLVQGLRQIRCGLALDRYDGDVSCAEVLQAISFDFAKLTPAFSQGLDRDLAKLARARTVVAQLEHRGVKSVATGVEDSQSLAYLWTAGVDYAQGFFLQEPSETITYEAAG